MTMVMDVVGSGVVLDLVDKRRLSSQQNRAYCADRICSYVCSCVVDRGCLGNLLGVFRRLSCRGCCERCGTRGSSDVFLVICYDGSLVVDVAEAPSGWLVVRKDAIIGGSKLDGLKISRLFVLVLDILK